MTEGAPDRAETFDPAIFASSLDFGARPYRRREDIDERDAEAYFADREEER